MISKSLKETEQTAKKFTQDLLGNLVSKSGAFVVAMHGDLGSGKTTFVKAVAQVVVEVNVFLGTGTIVFAETVCNPFSQTLKRQAVHYRCEDFSVICKQFKHAFNVRALPIPTKKTFGGS